MASAVNNDGGHRRHAVCALGDGTNPVRDPGAAWEVQVE